MSNNQMHGSSAELIISEPSRTQTDEADPELEESDFDMDPDILKAVRYQIAEAISTVNFQELDAGIAKEIEGLVSSGLEQSGAAVLTLIREEIDKELARISDVAIREVHIVDPKTDQVKTITGVKHKVFERVVQLACMRKAIFVPGPTGCGKTFLAEQLAEALELPFSMISCTSGMSESQLMGRLIPSGSHGQFEYKISGFIDSYENGGVFLIDEIDAGDPNALLIINSALSNDRISVPSRYDNPFAERHEDFVFIAAANTYGTGADRDYVGRNEIDAATLNRFQIGTVDMDYDKALETAICPLDELRFKLWRIRESCDKNRVHRIISTRLLKDSFDMITSGLWSFVDVQEAIFSGWTEDETTRVKEWIKANPDCIDENAGVVDQDEFSDVTL